MNIATGLQKIDNLSPSKYLKELIKENVNGKITTYEVEESLNNYYENKNSKERLELAQLECDIVSTRLTQLLNNESFSFNYFYLQDIHNFLFRGINGFGKIAGKFRSYNITKNEPILNNETVTYGDYLSIERTLQYDFEEEKNIDWGTLSNDECVKKISKFTSAIWQMHPFGEGNARTVAVIIIKYLKYRGFDISNDQFERNALYFRNALVRSNYAKREDNILPTLKYLHNFFENTLLGTNHELKNEEMQILK